MVINKYYSQEGKVWKKISDGKLLSNFLVLGVNDNIENYEQVDEPIEEEKNEQS